MEEKKAKKRAECLVPVKSQKFLSQKWNDITHEMELIVDVFTAMYNMHENVADYAGVITNEQ